MMAQTLGFLDDAPGLAWAARVAGRGELDALRLRQSVRRAAPRGPRVLPGLPRAELWTEVRPGTWEALLELFRIAFPPWGYTGCSAIGSRARTCSRSLGSVASSRACCTSY